MTRSERIARRASCDELLTELRRRGVEVNVDVGRVRKINRSRRKPSHVKSEESRRK